jgi:hypothetical protein
MLTFLEDTMGLFFQNFTKCHICAQAIETLSEAVSYPFLDGVGIVRELSDGFTHRTCALGSSAINDIRAAWSNHWQEQANVCDISAVVSEDAIVFRTRNKRLVVVSPNYLFVIEEMMSAKEQLIQLLGEPNPTGAEHRLPLNCYSLSKIEADVICRVTTRPKRPAPHDPLIMIEEEMALLELRLSREAWRKLATSLQFAIEALP